MKKSAERILALILVLAMSAALVSCAADSGNGQEGNGAGQGEGPEASALNIIDDKYRNYYEIFVWSFFDTDNDGIGDLKGVTEKLDYIKDLGFNGIWLMPITVGTSYHKYDVEDYYNVDPQFGTLDDYKALIAAAHERGINVIIDLVVNHTSSDHPWFKAACEYIRQRGTPGGDYGEYYNFSNGRQDGYNPVGGTGWYYESRFTNTMPDLNLDSEKVRAEIKKIMEFWIGLGTDGFRLDACTSFYTNSTQKSVEFLRWLNRAAKSIDEDCYLVGEAWYPNHVAVREYYNSGADSFFMFPLAMADGAVADCLKEIKSAPGRNFGTLLTTCQETYDVGVPAPFLSNHDTARIASFMGRSQKDKIKMAQGLLGLMNGAIYVYYGEEIGMISTADGSDPYKRIAMKWSDKSVYEGWCYTSPQGITVTKDNYVYPGVETQREDPDSIWSYYKKSLELRNRFPAIARGKVTILEDYYEQSGYCCVLTKTWGDETVTICVNLDREYEHQIKFDAAPGEYQDGLCAGDGAKIEYKDGTLTLPPYSIAIFK